MSRNCWESGSVKLPGAEWKRVRDALVAAWNARQVESLKLAQEVHARLVAIKSTGGSKAITARLHDMLKGNVADERLMERVSQMDLWKIQSAVLKRDDGTGKVSLVTPKKKDFPEEPSTKWTGCSFGDFSISVGHAEKTLGWNVSENNHAVEHAREHPMGVAFFKALGSVKWTRGTGGSLSGNDEYARDNREEGGGANYVTARFGPLGEASDPMHRFLKRAKSAAKRSGVRVTVVNNTSRRF